MCKLQEQAMERAGEVSGIFTSAFNADTLVMSGGTKLYDIHMHDVTITPTGFHYKGALIEDAGEAHRAFVAAMNRPVIMPGQPGHGAAVRGEAVAISERVKALEEFYQASTGWEGACGHPDATPDDERRAEERFIAAGKALRELPLSARAADAPSEPSRADLESIDRAMQHMGDTLNACDSADEHDEEVTAAGFAAIDRLLKSRAADALDSQPTDRTRHIAEWDSAADLLESQAAISAEEKETVSVCAAVLRRVARTGLCRDKSQPTVAAQQGSIGDDAQFMDLLTAVEVAPRYSNELSEVSAELVTYIDSLLDSRASSAPVAPIAPDAQDAARYRWFLANPDALECASFFDRSVLGPTATLSDAIDEAMRIEISQQEGSEAGNG